MNNNNIVEENINEEEENYSINNNENNISSNEKKDIYIYERESRILNFLLDIIISFIEKNSILYSVLESYIEDFKKDEDLLELISILCDIKKWKLSIKKYNNIKYEKSVFGLYNYKISCPLDYIIYSFLQNKSLLSLYNLYYLSIEKIDVEKLTSIVQFFSRFKSSLDYIDKSIKYKTGKDIILNSFVKYFNSTPFIFIKNIINKYILDMLNEANIEKFEMLLIENIDQFIYDIKDEIDSCYKMKKRRKS